MLKTLYCKYATLRTEKQYFLFWFSGTKRSCYSQGSRSVAPEPFMSAVFRVTTINPFVMAENVPVADRRTNGLYLDEVEKCDLYPVLFGNEYGCEDAMIFQG
jgi:hypothetical protein